MGHYGIYPLLHIKCRQKFQGKIFVNEMCMCITMYLLGMLNYKLLSEQEALEMSLATAVYRFQQLSLYMVDCLH